MDKTLPSNAQGVGSISRRELRFRILHPTGCGQKVKKKKKSTCGVKGP